MLNIIFTYNLLHGKFNINNSEMINFKVNDLITRTRDNGIMLKGNRVRMKLTKAWFSNRIVVPCGTVCLGNVVMLHQVLTQGVKLSLDLDRRF